MAWFRQLGCRLDSLFFRRMPSCLQLLVDLGDQLLYVGCHWAVGILLEKLLESLPGILGLFLSQQGVAQNDIDADIGLLQFDRLAGVHLRIRKFVQRETHLGKFEVGVGILWIELGEAGQRLFGQTGTAGLGIENAQQGLGRRHLVFDLDRFYQGGFGLWGLVGFY